MIVAAGRIGSTHEVRLRASTRRVLSASERAAILDACRANTIAMLPCTVGELIDSLDRVLLGTGLITRAIVTVHEVRS